MRPCRCSIFGVSQPHHSNSFLLSTLYSRGFDFGEAQRDLDALISFVTRGLFKTACCALHNLDSLWETNDALSFVTACGLYLYITYTMY